MNFNEVWSEENGEKEGNGLRQQWNQMKFDWIAEDAATRTVREIKLNESFRAGNEIQLIETKREQRSDEINSLSSFTRRNEAVNDWSHEV